MRPLLPALLLLAACPSPHTEPPHVVPDGAPVAAAPDAGPTRVAETPKPALRLPTSFTPTSYQADLVIDPKATTFDGKITIAATLSEPASVVWLNAVDLSIAKADAMVNDVDIPLKPEVTGDGYLALHAASDLPAGPLTIQMSYTGKFRTNDSTGAFIQDDGGDPYVVTQFEPIDARAVFPCFDEPSSKVPWTLTLHVPKGETAISNTPIDHQSDDGDQTTVAFQTTTPLPSYLVAFAVGPFEFVDAGKTPGGAPIRVAAFKGHSADAAYAAATAPKLMKILEDYFGIPYPFAKLDLVPIPSTTWFGAMENAGMITFAANLLEFPKGSSPQQLRIFDWVSGHEMAHQWFGDYVTLSWWNDIWLNEAFATWMEEKVMRQRPGWIDGEESGNRDSGLGSDELVSARRVRQPIDTVGDIQTAFDNITYQKGAAVIRMFEHWVGAKDFQAGVQQYLKDHAFKTTDVHDFLASVDAATPKDLTAPFSTFLDQVGAPLVDESMTCTGGKATVTLSQSRWLPKGTTAPAGDAPRWTIPVCLTYENGKKPGESCTVLDGESTTVALDRCPAWILPNQNAIGYYHMGIAQDAFAALVKKGWKQLTPEEQQLVFGDGEAMVSHGDLDPSAMLDMTSDLLAGSRNLIGDATGLAGGANQLISDDHREALRKWVRATFGPRARKLGWLPGAKDTVDADAVRGELVNTDAFIGRDPALLASALKLAKKWKDLPESVRGQVLAAAVLASPDFGKQLLGELDAITDRQMHSDAIGALSATEDPTLAKALLDRLLDPKVDLVQEQGLMWGLDHRPLFDQTEQWIETNYDALVPRMAELTRAGVVYALVGSCDAGKRDAIATWANAHLVPQAGGERTVPQALEGLDQCIAQKAAQGPSIDKWIAAHGK